jgi:hypothetical protein
LIYRERQWWVGQIDSVANVITPGPRIYIPQEQSGPVQSQSESQSHVMTDGRSVSMSWCRDHVALQRLYLNEI